MNNSDATQWSESAHDAVLDLMEVTLVDSEAFRFLVQCETKGLRLWWQVRHLSRPPLAR
jgi:hypothetical protein